MTQAATKPRVAFEPTDTIEGEYRTIVEDGHGLTLGERVDLVRTWTARVYFVRASDGVHELAWNGVGYSGDGIAARRATQARANMEMGRLRSYLRYHGIRREWQQATARKAKKAREEAEREALRILRNAAPAMLEALKTVVAQYRDADVVPYGILACRAAIALAEGK